MNVKPPHWALALSDPPRALVDAAVLRVTSPLLRRMPRGDGHAVMVIPGFMGNDRAYQPLIRFLNHLGYRATGWGQGRNLGPISFTEEGLNATVEDLAASGNISLIGHSLGGLYAREIARREPGIVRRVITLGSPFGSGRVSGSHAYRFYQRLNPQVIPEETDERMIPPPPVPTTAIYTRGDGIVNWRTSRQEGDWDNVDNIEVAGSHTGLNINAAVWYWLAKKLAET